MKHYCARRIAGGPRDGRWRYTALDAKADPTVLPVGYCAGDCDGHATPAEAEDHYLAYLLDTADTEVTFLAAHPCEVCGVRTVGGATTGPGDLMVHFLCEEHRNRETLETLIERPIQLLSSY